MKEAPSLKERKLVKMLDPSKRLRILLTNGRFPVSLDLARQLKKVGHSIVVVDPMKHHVCKYSRAVKKSYVAPAPHDDGLGYVEVVRRAIQEENIQLVIPMHEEIFILAQHSDIAPILFAPPYWQLLELHNKWNFSEMVVKAGLDVPTTTLIRNLDDLKAFDFAVKEYALKPVFGRAKKGVFHVKPNEPIPEIEISDECHYIAQEWINGKQLCSYGVARDGELKACSVYPVIDTIDGSSCVYFTSIDHPRIKHFMETLARYYNLTGQLAFDFIETEEKVYAIECNPRATSGIHLFKHTNWLSEAFTNPASERHDAKHGWTRQLFPGMLMWEHKGLPAKTRLQHVKRFASTRDVTFAKTDPGPAVMQPVLYMSYARLCHEKKLELKELFQWDMLWEPTAIELKKATEEKAIATGESAPIVA